MPGSITRSSPLSPWKRSPHSSGREGALDDAGVELAVDDHQDFAAQHLLFEPGGFVDGNPAAHQSPCYRAATSAALLHVLPDVAGAQQAAKARHGRRLDPPQPVDETR